MHGVVLALMLVATGAWRAYPDTLAQRLSGGKYETPAHTKLISTTIAQMVDSGGGLLLVEAPPRHGKSELVSRRVPIWFLAEHPDKHVTLAGYGASLPEAHSRFVRDTIAEHGAALGVGLASDSTAVDRWHTTAGGSCRAVGVGGALTGFGSHLLVIDDPISNAEEADSEIMRDKIWEWFLAVAWTRREPGCLVVVMCTRWHEDDLIGRILAHPQLGKMARRLTFPALAEQGDILGRPEGAPLFASRYDRAAILEIKGALSARWYNALYRQRPSAQEGNEILRSWWKYYDDLPVPFELLDYRLGSWDATFTDAQTSDWVVGQAWGVYGGYRYLLEQVRRRMAFVETCAEVAAMHQRWKCNASAIELAANGYAIVSSLQNVVPGIYGVPVAGKGKIIRARANSPQIKAGNVFLPRNAECTSEIVEEHASFPNGANDDMVDATSQALSELSQFVGVPVSHLTPGDDRFVPPHVLELQRRGVLGGLGRAPKHWRGL